MLFYIQNHGCELVFCILKDSLQKSGISAQKSNLCLDLWAGAVFPMNSESKSIRENISFYSFVRRLVILRCLGYAFQKDLGCLF